jgi:large subunit ribosomal protein L10
MAEQRQILVEKSKEVAEIKQLLKKHDVIALASLHKVRAAQLQAIRKKLRDRAYLRTIKNTLIKRAIKGVPEKPNIEKLEDHLVGSTIFLFTDVNPFKLTLLLDRSKVTTTAKAGDIAAFDVVVPAGNTGQPPGPIISQLGAVGLKTRIESGSVWISQDTTVAKEGETISARLAPVLSKLGIKPVETGLSLRAVYEEGLIIAGDQLHINVEKTKRCVEEAHQSAFTLALNSLYISPVTIELLLKQANKDAFNLSITENVLTKETVLDILRKAHGQMLSLKSLVERRQKDPQKD